MTDCEYCGGKIFTTEFEQFCCEECYTLWEEEMKK